MGERYRGLAEADIELLQFLMERGVLDPQDSGGLLLVPAGHPEGPDDDVLLDPVHKFFQEDRSLPA